MIKTVGFGRKASFYLKAAEFLSKLLRIEKLLSDKELTIIAKNMKVKFYGYFHIPYHYSVRDKIKKKFSLSISRKYLKDIGFMILLHEMLHLKQYLEGDTICLHSKKNSPAVAYWKGKNLGEIDKIEHKDRPWEIDVEKKMIYYSNKIIDKIIT